MTTTLAHGERRPEGGPIALENGANGRPVRKLPRAAENLLRKTAILSASTERLRMIVQQSGGTKQVAIRSGVALSTLGSYLAGGEMKLSTAMQICAACNSTLAWLVGDDRPAESLPEDKHVRVHASRSDKGAGQTILIDKEWVSTRLECTPDALVSLEVRGGAMEPTLRHGDLLLVDTSVVTVSSLALYAIDLVGEHLVRRLERCFDGSIIVHTDNARFAPQTIGPGQRDSLKLIGRVVWKASYGAL